MKDAAVSGPNDPAQVILTNEPQRIILTKVHYTYPSGLSQPALNAIDLSVRQGEYLLLSGASGSGKSTLARTFNGLIPHFYGGRLNGRIQIAGRLSANCTVSDFFDRVGMVFQNPRAQLFNRTVLRELAFGLESLGLPRRLMQTRIAAVAEALDITALLPLNPVYLSGGEQQLVALASVLVLDPAFVVLDEPLANLDAAHVTRLRALLRQLKARGAGIVVCEHRMTPTLPDADRIVLIHQGVKRLEGVPRDIMSDPAWSAYGIDLPLALQIGLRQGLEPLPMDMRALLTRYRAFTPPTPISRPTVFHATPTGPPLLKMDNVGYAPKGKSIVSAVSLDLYPGQSIALVGANGAGKTTLLKLIGGLLRPSSGQVWINGKRTTAAPAWELARQVGLAFQNPNSQFFKMTVREEIQIGPRALKCYDALWFEQLVELFKLAPLLDRAPFKLSGGEKKRVAFAAALAAKPRLLALDEPTAGQDGAFCESLAQLLTTLRQQGTAILVATHALDFAQRVCPDWAVMANGRIIEQGAPDCVMGKPGLMQQAGLEPTESFLWSRICEQ